MGFADNASYDLRRIKLAHMAVFISLLVGNRSKKRVKSKYDFFLELIGSFMSQLVASVEERIANLMRFVET